MVIDVGAIADYPPVTILSKHTRLEIAPGMRQSGIPVVSGLPGGSRIDRPRRVLRVGAVWIPVVDVKEELAPRSESGDIGGRSRSAQDDPGADGRYHI